MKCPFCGEESFAKKKNIMDGWRVVGTVEVCALCNQQLPGKNPEKAAVTPDAARKASLAALLGADVEEKVTLAGTSDRDFCRNCRHFIEHPFRTLCGKDGSSADPMGSCPDFAER